MLYVFCIKNNKFCWLVFPVTSKVGMLSPSSLGTNFTVYSVSMSRLATVTMQWFPFALNVHLVPAVGTTPSMVWSTSPFDRTCRETFQDQVVWMTSFSLNIRTSYQKKVVNDVIRKSYQKKVLWKFLNVTVSKTIEIYQAQTRRVLLLILRPWMWFFKILYILVRKNLIQCNKMLFGLKGKIGKFEKKKRCIFRGEYVFMSSTTRSPIQFISRFVCARFYYECFNCYFFFRLSTFFQQISYTKLFLNFRKMFKILSQTLITSQLQHW